MSELRDGGPGAGMRTTSAADLEARLREDFPYRDGRVYLNSAGAGLPWRGAGAVVAEHYAQIARLGADAQPHWHEMAARTRARVASMLGVDLDEVAFLRSTTEVMNLAAASFDWSPGDEVLYPEGDFPSVVLPWASALAAGAHPIAVAVPDESSRTDALIEAITERTRMVAVTHVHATTGTRVDLDRLGTACRAVDALLVVDGIEALGAIPIDLDLVDVYGAGVFKWLLSGFGTAIGIFRERTATRLSPAYRGYANPAPSPRFEYSEPNFPGLAVLDATLAYLDDLGWATVHERVRTHTARVSDIVEARGFDIVTPDARAGIIAFRTADAPGLVARLSEQGVDVVAKQGLVRVSPHVYTTNDDINRFEAAFTSVSL